MHEIKCIFSFFSGAALKKWTSASPFIYTKSPGKVAPTKQRLKIVIFIFLTFLTLNRLFNNHNLCVWWFHDYLVILWNFIELLLKYACYFTQLHLYNFGNFWGFRIEDNRIVYIRLRLRRKKPNLRKNGSCPL